MIGHILPTNNNSALDILPIPREDNGALFVKNSSYKQKTTYIIDIISRQVQDNF